MVLVSVFPIVGKNEVWRDCLFQLLENRLYLATYKWHEPVRERLENWSPECSRLNEQRSGAARFTLSCTGRVKNYPMKHAGGVFLSEAKNCPATTNFDVIGMRPKAKDFQRLFSLV